MLIRKVEAEAITPSPIMPDAGHETELFEENVDHVYCYKTVWEEETIAEAELVVLRDLHLNVTETRKRYAEGANEKLARFTNNSLTRGRDNDEPRMRSALGSPERDSWLPAQNYEASTLKPVSWWEEAERPEKAQGVH